MVSRSLLGVFARIRPATGTLTKSGSPMYSRAVGEGAAHRLDHHVIIFCGEPGPWFSDRYRSRMFNIWIITTPPEDGGGIVMISWPR